MFYETIDTFQNSGDMKDLNQNEIFSWFYLKLEIKKIISQGIINGKKMADHIFKKEGLCNL